MSKAICLFGGALVEICRALGAMLDGSFDLPISLVNFCHIVDQELLSRAMGGRVVGLRNTRRRIDRFANDIAGPRDGMRVYAS